MPFSANTNQSFFPSLLCLSINRAIYLSLTPELNRQVAKYWPPGSKLHPLFSQDFSKVFQSLFFPQKKLVPPRRTDETEENNTTRRPANFQRSLFATRHFFSRPLISQLIRPTSPLGRMKLAVRRLIFSGAESEAVHLLPRVYLVPFTTDLS